MVVSRNGLKFLVMVVVLMIASSSAYGGNFNDEFERTFGDSRVRTFGKDGQLLSLSLDKGSGSGFRSKREYLFGRVDMQMKLVSGDSAGTVTTLYLSSEGDTHDEIDFEFLGNASGQPYTLHTNVFSQGRGDREQQFQLWFDPTRNFHTYSIVWNTKQILFLVDNIPIRVHKNRQNIGVPFPTDQPMRIYSSLWNADDWATQGGRVKTDWSKAPFTAYYRNFNIDACEGTAGSSCATVPTTTVTDAVTDQSTTSTNEKSTQGSWRTRDLDANERKRLRWVQKHHMVYDYCQDSKRFSQGYPKECKYSRI